MRCKATNVLLGQAINQELARLGMKKFSVAQELKISRQSLSQRLWGVVAFRPEEIEKLCGLFQEHGTQNG